MVSKAPETRRTIPISIGERGINTNLLYQQLGHSSLVNLLGLEIVSGRYAAGELLPKEAVMRERYGVSRTALRETYSKLTAKGLVEARPKVGTSVRARHHWNMLDQDVLGWHLATVPAASLASDLYALRRMIEPGAAALAAQFRTEEDLATIYANFNNMVENSSDERELVDADFSFHLAILAATKNPFINAFSSLIHAAMISTFELSWRGAEVIKKIRLDQHKDVADAIAEKDVKRARQNMEVLLDESINDVKSALA